MRSWNVGSDEADANRLRSHSLNENENVIFDYDDSGFTLEEEGANGDE